MTNPLSRREAAAFFAMLFCGCLAFFLLGVYAGRRSVQAPPVPVETRNPAPVSTPQDLGFYRDMLASGEPGSEGESSTRTGSGNPADAASESRSGEPNQAPDPTSPEVPTPTVPARVFWTVQVGALDSAEEARRVILRLEAEGYSARLIEPRSGVKDYYRVWVGEFEDADAAKAFEVRLKADGFHTYPKKVQEPVRSN